MSNTNLKTAKKSKNDEFYTRYEDIKKEMKFYTDYLKGKWVYSSCDDYRFSQFKTYFVNNFHTLGLKHFTCTNYDIGEGAYRYDYNGQNEVITPLNGDGDFRSEECIEYLKECDVVVTNPPFSLFRQYVKQLMDYNKKFIIIGNKNALTYKEVFSFIKENKLWLGISSPNDFIQPSYAVKKSMAGLTRWFTNIENKKRTQPIDLYKRYSFEEYPKYDHYDAINVDKVADIPMDYDGIMGVPITFLDNYCPSQFEINGLDRYVEDNPHYGHRFTIKGKETYARILIRKIMK